MGGGGQEAEVLVTIADNVDVEEVSSDSDFEPVVGKFGTGASGGGGEDNANANANANANSNNNNKKDNKKDKDKANKAATTSETLSFVFHDGELKTKLIFTIGFLAAIGNGLVRILRVCVCRCRCVLVVDSYAVAVLCLRILSICSLLCAFSLSSSLYLSLTHSPSIRVHTLLLCFSPPSYHV